MANLPWIIAISSLVIVSAIGTTSAVNYTVTNSVANTHGGAKFDTDIGADYSRQTMEDATNFIWYIFQQSNPSDRKSYDAVNLFIDDSMNYPAYTVDNQIHVNGQYIYGYPGDVKTEITGVLYHEMTHVWQWNGPGWLIEGIADFIRLKARYVPSHWPQPGQGNKWDEGYAVTAWFLDYCDGMGSGGFVAELNKKMRDDYSDSYFEELLGKSVDALWADYKASFNN